jgi:hypothetical protein
MGVGQLPRIAAGGRTGFSFVRTHQLFFGLCAFRGGVEERELVVVDHRRAAVAVHLQARAEPRIGGGGGVQHAERAALEPHHPGRDVLHLDPLVCQRAGVGEHLHRPAERRDEQVDGVHALVHQRAAAVQLPGAPPVAGVVVALPAPPVDRRDARGDPAELAAGDGREGGLGGRVEPVLRDDRDQGAGLVLGLDDPIGAGHGDLGGLLHDDVLAGLEGLDGHLAVPPGRRADHHDVDLLGGQRAGQ